jgi:hypothetical protein
MAKREAALKELRSPVLQTKGAILRRRGYANALLLLTKNPHRLTFNRTPN